MNDPAGIGEPEERMVEHALETAETGLSTTASEEMGNSATETPVIVLAEQSSSIENSEAEPEAAVPRQDWHALYTRHQHEKVTARVLTHKGFEVFLPLYNTAHRWKDRTKKLALPLFPCYVFVRGGMDRRLEILSTPGIHCLVRSGDGIAVIPDHEIESVRRVVAGSVPVEPYPFLRTGDRVRIKEGSLAGLEGILVRQKDRFRVVLSVNLLRRSIAVEVDATAVGVVGHRAAVVPRCTPSSRWRSGESHTAGRIVRGS
jgi:transcription antitermination factor NusG